MHGNGRYYDFENSIFWNREVQTIFEIVQVSEIPVICLHVASRRGFFPGKTSNPGFFRAIPSWNWCFSFSFGLLIHIKPTSPYDIDQKHIFNNIFLVNIGRTRGSPYGELILAHLRPSSIKYWWKPTKLYQRRPQTWISGNSTILLRLSWHGQGRQHRK